MKWIFLISSIMSVIGAIITAPEPQSHTMLICGVVYACTFFIILEIQKLK